MDRLSPKRNLSINTVTDSPPSLEREHYGDDKYEPVHRRTKTNLHHPEFKELVTHMNKLSGE